MSEQTLMLRPLPATARQIKQALAARLWTQPGYRIRHIRPRNPDLLKVHRDNFFAGAAQVAVSDHPGVEMYFFSDDTVARVYFYFGRDSFESTSVYLWSHLARQARGVLDIGAYTGLYSLLAARAAHRADVVAFEPIPHLAERIRENAALNGLENVEVIGNAISDFNAPAEITHYGAAPNTPGSSLRPKPAPVRGTETVMVRSIDKLAGEGLIPPHVDLIKLDTEGDEVNALAGAMGCLTRDRPVIQSEVLDDEALTALIDLAREMSYEVFFVNEEARTLTRLLSADGSTAETVTVGHGFSNVLMSPNPERSAELLAAAEKFAGKPRIYRPRQGGGPASGPSAGATSE